MAKDHYDSIYHPFLSSSQGPTPVSWGLDDLGGVDETQRQSQPDSGTVDSGKSLGYVATVQP